MWKKMKFKHLISVLFAAVVLLGISKASELVTKNAIFMPNPSDSPKSLTVYYTFNDQGIDGATINIYKFADINIHNGRAVYSLTSDFIEAEVDFTALTTKQSTELAKNIDLTNKNALKSSTTDSKGEVKFTNLDSGLYLVVQSGKSGTAAAYEMFDTFIMAVPYAEYDYENTDEIGNFIGEWTDNVICYPKTETVRIPEAPSTPQTGDNFGLTLLAVLAGISLICVILSTNGSKHK